jgi:hypothetical protein
MTNTRRRRARAAGAVLALTIATGAACSPGSGSKSKAAGASSTAPSGSGTTAAGALACRSTTAGTSGGGSGDVLVPGDIPDTQKFVTYHSSDGYHLDYPEGWAQMQSGSAVTFTDKFNSIRVETTSAPTAPTVAATQSTDVAALAASTPCFQAGKVTQVRRKAGSTVLITYRADSSADPVTGKVIVQDVERYQFWQAGKLVTITLASPKGSDNVDPWRTVTDSFGWGQ